MKDFVAGRLKHLPPYIFDALDHKRKAIQKQGKDLIDLSVGDPDIMPNRPLIQLLKSALDEPAVHRYPPYKGTEEMLQTIAGWYKKKSAQVNSATEIWTLIGSKEGIAHLIWATVNPGDIVLVPDPCYPAYRSAIILAGGKIVSMPLHRQNGFLPNLSAIKPAIAKKAKLMMLNYPSNPTSADAPKEFYQDVVRFAKKYGIIVCQDAAYSEIYYDKPPVSFLSVPGAKEVGVEINSFSKTFSIAGWRMGWAAGNADIIKALGRVKTNIDSGAFVALQNALCQALKHPDKIGGLAKIRQTYQKRRDIIIQGLREIVLDPIIPN
ncbi:MAG: aminotransferase class I/II-fold pyridoxal phosphate-dependent enzyme, partial [Planctomycetes bacterium]|nr:aminotransferase class I/II-fold pyridoxal phosphate-dependent enzyme [Planctomycetota bacterium]